MSERARIKPCCKLFLQRWGKLRVCVNDAMAPVGVEESNSGLGLVTDSSPYIPYFVVAVFG
jgi:hypothetical protein